MVLLRTLRRAYKQMLVGQKKTSILRELITSPQLTFIMEAHSGLSAKIVQEAGFHGIWASGLSISAALGVRDNNEASWTQVLEVLEFMSENTNIPILLDGDTGYGNFNNARRLIQKLESRGIAGVCLEDKLFPKTNSFIEGPQPLADIQEFCGKIKACKDTQKDKDFVVVARLESFIAGQGLEDALKRATAYQEAGADAILCHSKRSDSQEIDSFLKEWKNKCPVIIVPTKYWKIPTQRFRDQGVSMIIWANHNIRSSIKVMQETTQRIFDEQSLVGVETDGKIVPVTEVFRLQDAQELKQAEKKYLSYRPLTEEVRNFIPPAFFVKCLEQRGTNFYSGVPDSLLKDFCAYITDNIPSNKHIIAANEGNAVALAAGHYLSTGRIPLVYLQNSGMGNVVNPILSLCHKDVYSVPVLLMIGWRGEPGRKDEPQHIVQGKMTETMLKDLGVPFEILPDFQEGIDETLDKAYNYMHSRKAPFALLVRKRTFEKYAMTQIKEGEEVSQDVNQQHFDISQCMTRQEVIQKIVSIHPTIPIVSTTGFASRELFFIREKNNQSHGYDFLTVGSMGHCSSIGLGMALSKPKQKVIVIDGDGACVMHMGSMHTIGKLKPKNLIHILINNDMHDSVGGQIINTIGIDFANISKTLGYKESFTVQNDENLNEILQKLEQLEGPIFIDVKVKPGVDSKLGRPTQTPTQNRNDFMQKNLSSWQGKWERF